MAGARQQSAELAKSLREIKKARGSLTGSRIEPTDTEFALKRFIIDADGMCQRFQGIDAVMAGAHGQAKPFCNELADLIANLKDEYSDVVSDLMVFVCRTLRVQESFSLLLSKAKRDAQDAQNDSKEHDEQRQRVEHQMTEMKREADKRISQLEAKMEEMKEEEVRLELEASRPAWQWQQEVEDPNSTMPSKDWFEAELEYLRNRNSALELRNTMLTTQKTDDLERAKNAERHIAKLQARVEELETHVKSFEQAIPVRADKTCQTQSEDGMWVQSIQPKVIFRGGNVVTSPYWFTLTPIKSGLGEPYSIPNYDLELPPNFQIIYQDTVQVTQLESKSKNKGKEAKGKGKGGRLIRKSSSKRLLDALTAGPDAADVAGDPIGERVKRPQSAKKKIREDENPFKTIAQNADDDSAVVLNLRTTTKWIGEVWYSHMSSLPSAAVADLGDNDLEHCCADAVGRSIWELFCVKYGGSQDAEVHVGDLVHSMRYYRDENPRCRVLAEFAGLEARKSSRAFRLHLWVMEKLSSGFRPDDDNGVVWVPLALVDTVAKACAASRGAPSAGEVAEWLQSDMYPKAVDDPLEAGEQVVDSDLAAEGIANMLLAEDMAALEQIVQTICEGAEQEEVVSLPRFMSVMQTLNGTLDAEELVAWFERPVPEGDRGYITNDELMQYATDHPMPAGQLPSQAARRREELVGREELAGERGEADVEGGEGEPVASWAQLRAALDHFWYNHRLRIRKYLAQLRAKEQRVSHLIDTFCDRYEAIEGDLSGCSLACCWVTARLLQGETLPQYGRPVPWPKPKPRPSFFRSKERQLHIMKAMLPRVPRPPSAPLLQQPVWEADATLRDRVGSGPGGPPSRLAGPVVQFRDKDIMTQAGPFL